MNALMIMLYIKKRTNLSNGCRLSSFLNNRYKNVPSIKHTPVATIAEDVRKEFSGNNVKEKNCRNRMMINTIAASIIKVFLNKI